MKSHLQLGRTMTFVVALSCSLIAGSAQAQNPNTYLYIAHAASGRAISSTGNPEFPVDIQVDNICMVKGQSFGEIRGPYSGVAGTFTFQISEANSGAPCTNPAIFSAGVTFSTGNSYLGIITLDSSNKIIGQVYPLSFSPIPNGQARIMVANATLQGLSATLAFSPSGAAAGTLNIPASSVSEGAPPTGQFTTSIYLEGTKTLETGPAAVQVENRNLYLYVLGGSATNNSVQLIGPKVIRDIF
jgi:hypothetical protein